MTQQQHGVSCGSDNFTAFSRTCIHHNVVDGALVPLAAVTVAVIVVAEPRNQREQALPQGRRSGAVNKPIKHHL